MKLACLILLISLCPLMQAIAYASVFDSSLPQGFRSSASAEKDRASDAEQASRPSESKGHKEAAVLQARTARRHSSRKTASSNHVILPKGWHLKPARNKQEFPPFENTTTVRPTSSIRPTGESRKVASHNPVPIGLRTGYAIGGQQFESGRNRSAIAAAVGGSADAKRNTSSINGTEVNRRH